MCISDPVFEFTKINILVNKELYEYYIMETL